MNKIIHINSETYIELTKQVIFYDKYLVRLYWENHKKKGKKLIEGDPIWYTDLPITEQIMIQSAKNLNDFLGNHLSDNFIKEHVTWV